METPANTLFSDIKYLLSRHEGFTSLLAALGTFFIGTITGAITAYSFVKHEVDATVANRLAPYESLLTGMSLNQGEDFDYAAKTFREAVKTQDISSLPARAQDAVYDGLLYAIVNSSRPEEYLPELNAVKTRIGEKATETPWRTCQISWYFLRTGKAKEAREYFARAKQLYDARGELSFAAQPLRGLLLAALTDGQLDDALDFAAEIKQRNPAKYADNADLAKDMRQ
jgi:hypothetical protein